MHILSSQSEEITLIRDLYTYDIYVSEYSSITKLNIKTFSCFLLTYINELKFLAYSFYNNVMIHTHIVSIILVIIRISVCVCLCVGLVIHLQHIPTVVTAIVELLLPIGLVTVHVYIPLLFKVTKLILYSARNTALVLLCSIAVILVDGIVGPLSFCQVNMSGGEPCEVQFNVRGDPTSTVTVEDDNAVFIIGIAVREMQIT